MLTSNADLARKLEDLEQKYDRQFKIVFDAIRQLMVPPPTKSDGIGFRPGSRKTWIAEPCSEVIGRDFPQRQQPQKVAPRPSPSL